MTISTISKREQPRINVAAIALAFALVAAWPTILHAQRAVEPCDIYAGAGTPCVAAHSMTRALYANYDGPIYQVVRRTDGKRLDIGLLIQGGAADAAAQDAFCNGAACMVTRIYDQSPFHNDLSIEGAGGNGLADTVR